jgi:hypothetical protein
MIMRVMTVAAGLFLVCGSLAQAQSLSGCWSREDSQGTTTRICFDGDGGGAGSFRLDWALKDPTEGWTSGSCSGFLTVQTVTNDRVAFTVPRQDDACYQNGIAERLALRVYDCERYGVTLICDMQVFYDDGTLFRAFKNMDYHS